MLSLYKYYFGLRLKFIYRSLGDHRNLWSLIISTLIIISGYIIATDLVLDRTKVYATLSITTILVVQYHINRRDGDFLRIQLDSRSLYILQVIEYMLLLFPIIIILLIKNEMLAWTLTAIPILLPLLKHQRRSSSINISPFAKGNFEWNTGLRKNMLVQSLLLIVFILSCIYRVNFIMSLLIMAVNLVVFAIYNNIHEPIDMIIKYNSAKELLRSKITFMTKSILMIGTVYIVILSVSYATFNWYAIMILAQVWILLITSILVKYSYYPNRMAAELNLVILTLMCIIPFLAPLVLLSLSHYYKKAESRLNKYFRT